MTFNLAYLVAAMAFNVIKDYYTVQVVINFSSAGSKTWSCDCTKCRSPNRLSIEISTHFTVCAGEIRISSTSSLKAALIVDFPEPGRRISLIGRLSKSLELGSHFVNVRMISSFRLPTKPERLLSPVLYINAHCNSASLGMGCRGLRTAYRLSILFAHILLRIAQRHFTLMGPKPNFLLRKNRNLAGEEVNPIL
jgi:hypothetical protein